MAPFGIKKCLKASIRRLKIGYMPGIVRNCPRTASKIVDNTIGAVNVFKK